MVRPPDVFNRETDVFEGRGLTDWMMTQFTDSAGLLHPVLKAVADDPERGFQLEIRRHYVNIYYRGGNLMEIRQPDPHSPRLTGNIDRRYIQKYSDNQWRVPPTSNELEVHEWLDENEMLGLRVLQDRTTVEKHVASFGHRRLAMDSNKARRPKHEREAQQNAARVNDGVGSEYLVCDVEYSVAHENPRVVSDKNKTSFLDMVAAYLPGRDSARAQLTLIELKYGASAIDGAAGLRDHLEDLSRLLAKPGSVDAVIDEVSRMARQKHRLGLTSVPVPVFEKTPEIEYIIAVAAHNPCSQVLRDALLGRHGLDEQRLISPDGLRTTIAILDDDLVLRRERLIALEDITEDCVPPEIFCGTLRQRRWRKGETHTQ